MTELPLFHVNVAALEPGAQVTASVARIRGETTYFDRITAGGLAWVERALEGARPGPSPSRSTCVFAFEKLGHALYYLRDGAHLYEVVAAAPSTRCPFALCDILGSTSDGSAAAIAAAEEYWSCSRDWAFIEVLAEALTVVRRLDPPADFVERAMEASAGALALVADRERAKAWIQGLS